MAGGKGTRISAINSDVPKPMIQINKKPILEYQINNLKSQQCTDIILVVGHMKSIIKKYFGDGTRFGVHIEYIEEEKPLGTAGAIYFLKNKVKEDFLLLNGDIIFDVDIERFVNYHKRKETIATIFTHPNDHPYDSGIIVADKDNRVIKWFHKEDEKKWYKNRVNAGLHMFSAKIFEYFDSLEKRDLDRDILRQLIDKRELAVYDSPEYVRDMGTPDRYYSVIEDIKSGKVRARNLMNKQKAIFLDRDGTINRYVGFLTDIDKFELIERVDEAIRLINRSGYLAIVITNQPVIARGDISIEDLNVIHNKMETLLGQKGAYLDDIFYCPHHPDEGFAGERKEYKIQCECRKPKPGMLLAAAQKYNIELADSWMIGDSMADMEAGKEAGCKICMIGDKIEQGLQCFSDLYDCIKYILEGGSKNERKSI